MNLESALDTIANALEGYAEDCVGRDNQEALQELDKAWAVMLKNLKDND